MGKASSILATMIVLALGGLCVLQGIWIEDARKDLQASVVPVSPDTNEILVAEAVPEPSPAEDAVVVEQEPAEVQTGAVAAAEGEGEGKEQSPGEKLQAMMKTLVKSMNKDGALKSMIRAQAAKMANDDFADLFKYLDLDPADKEALTKLFQEKYAIHMELWMAMNDEELSPEERRKLEREAREKAEEIDRAIAELLGEDEHAVYEDYAKKLPYRKQLAPFKQKLFAAGLDLTWEQEDALLAMLQEDPKKKLTPEEDPELYNISQLLPEERSLKEQEIWLRYMKVHHGRYLDSAGEILSEEQLRLFEQFLAEREELTESWVEFMPQEEQESHDRAEVSVGRESAVLSEPVAIDAGKIETFTWGDNPGGSRMEIFETEGNMLGIRADVNSGWGAGLTMWPEHAVQNSDKSANAAGASRIVVRLNAPEGVRLRFGLLESGHGWPGQATFEGANGADGEAFRHEGLTTAAGWGVYTIPLSELKLNGGYGNQKGNRTIDTQAIKGLEILVPGGQENCLLEVDWIRIE